MDRIYNFTTLNDKAYALVTTAAEKTYVCSALLSNLDNWQANSLKPIEQLGGDITFKDSTTVMKGAGDCIYIFHRATASIYKFTTTNAEFTKFTTLGTAGHFKQDRSVFIYNRIIDRKSINTLYYGDFNILWRIIDDGGSYQRSNAVSFVTPYEIDIVQANTEMIVVTTTNTKEVYIRPMTDDKNIGLKSAHILGQVDNSIYAVEFIPGTNIFIIIYSSGLIKTFQYMIENQSIDITQIDEYQVNELVFDGAYLRAIVADGFKKDDGSFSLETINVNTQERLHYFHNVILIASDGKISRDPIKVDRFDEANADQNFIQAQPKFKIIKNGDDIIRLYLSIDESIYKYNNTNDWIKLEITLV